MTTTFVLIRPAKNLCGELVPTVVSEHKSFAEADRRAGEAVRLYPRVWVERWLDFPDGKRNADHRDLKAKMETVVKEYTCQDQ